jgi:RNA recognition motif-containing protein
MRKAKFCFVSQLLLLSTAAVSAWIIPLAHKRQQVASRSSASKLYMQQQQQTKKSQFAQPAFSQRPKQQQKQQPSFASDSTLGSLHQQRLQTAGRVGTKRYVNPCKVFFGNLPFDADETALSQWFTTCMGLPAAILLHDLKIVRDWKTGKSKGYGFAVLTDPVYATVAIIQGRTYAELNGRRVRIDQGQRRPEETLVLVRKNSTGDSETKKQQLDVEEEPMTYEEAALMATLDRDLVPIDMQPPLLVLSDEDNAKNREGRRKALRELKREAKRNKPNGGFGTKTTAADAAAIPESVDDE